jgi:hypothetical protein
MIYSRLGQTGKIIVLVIIFTLIYWLYSATVKAKYDETLTHKIVEVPDALKCFFGEDRCDEGDIDYWTLLHGIVYFIIGVLVPDQYLIIVLISIGFELFQPYLGNSSRYIINPLVNLTGYAIGSVLNKSVASKSDQLNYSSKYSIYVN